MSRTPFIALHMAAAIALIKVALSVSPTASRPHMEEAPANAAIAPFEVMRRAPPSLHTEQYPTQ